MSTPLAKTRGASSSLTEAELREYREQQHLREQILELREGLPHLYGLKWYQWAWDFFSSDNKMNLLCAGNQIGKALHDDTEIPTPQGFKKMGSLQVGDEVFGRDGLPTKIIDLPFKGATECFRITFDDGSEVIASGEHVWICKTSRERFVRSYTRNWPRSRSKASLVNESFDTWREATTREIIALGQYSPVSPRAKCHVSIPVTSPLAREDSGAFDPYLVGLILGDGGLTGDSVLLTSGDREIQDYVLKNYDAVPTGKYGFRMRGLVPQMRALGLMGLCSAEKFIPTVYLSGSVEERLALLRGLMDSDGTVTAGGVCSLTTVSSALARDALELVSSLGGKAKVSRRKSGYKNSSGDYVPCKDAYTLRLNILENPFLLSRKAALFKASSRRHERVIRKIESVGEAPATCITVANADGSFLATRAHIVTHNSSCQIRKCIEWAGNPQLWPKLWPGRTPRVFWYFYPTQDVINTEAIVKWEPEFLPRGEYKDHPTYGWKFVLQKRDIVGIQFNSGILLQFKSYGQKVVNLQTTTVDAVFTDEEIPESYYSEIAARLIATDGYYHMVFTATLGQKMWEMAIEGKGTEELFPEAWKRQVSMYDCLQYKDGSPGPFTPERIDRVKAKCKSQAEVDKRVYGRFVQDEDLTYFAFDSSVNVNVGVPKPLPSKSTIYSSVDVGAGGNGHPAAFVFIVVAEDFRSGRVFRGWRGDDGMTRTAGDVLSKYLEVRGSLDVSMQSYDWQAKDFGTMAQRAGEPFIHADKDRKKGIDSVNTLFRSGCLTIDQDPELSKLIHELARLRTRTGKTSARDDFCDALRYCVMSIPWDWSYIKGEPTTIEVRHEEKIRIESKTREQLEQEQRRGIIDEQFEEEGWSEIEEEFAFWSDLGG